MRLPMWLVAVVALSLLGVSAARAASLDKAKALRANGLFDDAKKELIEVAFADQSSRDEKAEAFLVLGDIGIDQENAEAATLNWQRVLDSYQGTAAAVIAAERLKLFYKLKNAPATPATRSPEAPAVQPKQAPATYPPGTVLVTAPDRYPWAAVEIAGALAPGARPFEGSLSKAMALAASESSIRGVVAVVLTTDAAYESGRVVCYLPRGGKAWEAKVMLNFGGGEERIARRFVEKLSVKVRSKGCP